MSIYPTPQARGRCALRVARWLLPGLIAGANARLVVLGRASLPVVEATSRVRRGNALVWKPERDATSGGSASLAVLDVGDAGVQRISQDVSEDTPRIGLRE